MKTINKIFTLSLIAALGFLQSCNKFLDVNPDMRTELNSVEKVAELLATAYPQASYITFTEAMTDNAGDKGAGTVEIINSAPYRFEDVADINRDSPTNYWNAAYAAIAAANHALEAIEKAGDDPAYRPYRGEALVARAYAHFMLVNFFAQPYDAATAATNPGVPYVTEVGKVVIGKYDRSTVAETYNKIEKDLLEGLPLLDNAAYKKAPKYHFTVSAAHAFATRFYLFKKEYEKTIEHANQVFVGGDIASNLRAINSEAYRSLQYYELQAQYTRAETPANLLLAEAPSVWGRNYAFYRYSLTNDILNELFTTSNVTDGSWAYNIYGRETTLNIPKFREHFVRQTLNAETGIPYNMVPLFTAEEVLFNRAEAYAELSRFDNAIKDLNDFASKRIIYSFSIPIYVPELHSITDRKLLAFYKTADLKRATIQCVLDFKRVDFIFEGQRWFDIIRHNLPVTHKTSDNETLVLGVNDPMRVFQIPQEAQSSGIELNPR